MVERQISWSHLQQRIMSIPQHEVAGLDQQIGPYITVSRLHGSGGGKLARALGERLGWAVVDQEIVEHISQSLQIDRHVLEPLDESRANWVRDVVADLMPVRIVDRDTYVTHLERVIKMLALHGKVVFVGRGAQLFLPRSNGLRVRVIAPETYCLEELQDRSGATEHEARGRMNEQNRIRADLVRRYFGKSIDDPTLYDLVLNSATLSLETQLEIVLTACPTLLA